MKLKAGKYYKTRDGRAVGPMEEYGYENPRVFHLGNGIAGLWSSEGTYIYMGSNHSQDLIAIHHKSPSKKKLMRIIDGLLSNDGEAYDMACVKAHKILKKWGNQC